MRNCLYCVGVRQRSLYFKRSPGTISGMMIVVKLLEENLVKERERKYCISVS